jgi:hypothetical protein
MNKKVLGVLLIIIGLICPSIVLVKDIKFTQNCKGYLEQSANANTVELSKDRLDKAISYIEANHLVTGYTSIFLKTEDENVEFWYNNLKACQKELELGKKGTQLEKTNLLMKVRESIMKNDGTGDSAIIPDGISRYPHNLMFAILNLISLLIITVGCSLVFYYY